jgi:hypothetical protein
MAEPTDVRTHARKHIHPNVRGACTACVQLTGVDDASLLPLNFLPARFPTNSADHPQYLSLLPCWLLPHIALVQQHLLWQRTSTHERTTD